MTATDTSPAAHVMQMRLYREAGPQRRAEIAAELSDAIREMCRTGVRLRHPEFSDTEVTQEMVRIFYGRGGSDRP
jgi:hypothetical protein